MKCSLPHFELMCAPLHWSSIFVTGLNLLLYYGHWYLEIRIDVFLAFNKTDKVEQLGERSGGQARANIIFG